MMLPTKIVDIVFKEINESKIWETFFYGFFLSFRLS